MNIETQKIRTRFAPSPTGFVHIGSLRTALFAFLLTRHTGGVNILRIEDTDQNRLVQGALENLVRVLQELGIEFDEGYSWDKEKNTVYEHGNSGPYLQSKRLDIYQKYVGELLEKQAAYYCYCSEQRLEDLRKEQTALKKPPMYDRHCRNLSFEEREQQLHACLEQGRKPVVRMAIPLDGKTTVHDIIFGDITYDHAVLDDQVILKSDGFPTYHLAVVVDDHLMNITHVLRGDEWLPSTPKHLLLYKAFGWEPTQFAHLPLILNTKKAKLSKRHDDVAVEDFLKKGYLKEALVNFVALLGWNPKTEQEIFSTQELIEQFDLSKINKSGAIFDLTKLDWFNSQYIKKLPPQQLAEKLMPFWQEAGVNIHAFKPQYLVAIAELEQERLKKLSEIGESTGYFFTDPAYEASLLVWKKSDLADAKTKLTALLGFLTQLGNEKFTHESLDSEIKNFISLHNFDTGAVLWPMRVALTGLERSPGPFEVASTLHIGFGKEKILERIQNAVNKL